MAYTVICDLELWQKLSFGEPGGSRLSAAWFRNSYTPAAAAAADQHTE